MTSNSFILAPQAKKIEVFLLKFDDFPLKFIKLRAAGAKKNENLKTLFSTFNEIWKISKPSFQDSENFENPQNPPCEIWNSIFQNLKNLILWSPEATLKDPTPSVDMDLAQYDPTT